MIERLRSERGVTLVELLVTVMIGLVVLGTVVMVVNLIERGSGRVSARVDANQQARPVMQRIMDQLHSTCVVRGVAPILPGSTGSSISFMHRTGSGANLTPQKRQISLSGGQLVERLYNPTSSWSPTNPNSFSSTPLPGYNPRILLDGVGQAEINGAVVPVFRYYSYAGTQLSSTPLPTPLSTENAERTVKVDVAFTVDPTSNPTGEETATVAISDSAVLRFAPAGETTTPENLPCL